MPRDSWTNGLMSLRRPRLGVGIGRDQVSAVLISHGAIRWWASEQRTPNEDLSVSLGKLFTGYRVPRLWQPVVTFAVGPSAVQVKHARSLPAVTDRRALIALVQENVARFFLTSTTPLLVAVATAFEDGAWMAAYDGATIEEVRRFSTAINLRHWNAVPTVIAVAHLLRDGVATWTDGAVAATIDVSGGCVQRIRHGPSDVPAQHASMFVRGVQSLGRYASQVADAHGAASLPAQPELRLRIQRPPAVAAVGRRRQLTLAAVALLASIVWALVAPQVRTALAVRAEAHRLAAISPRVRTASARMDSLTRVSAMLAGQAAFTTGAHSMLLLLAEFTRAMPDSAALVSLQVDSTDSGVLTAFAPRASLVVDAVERVPDVGSPTIVGPVTRQSLGGQTVERVTVRFHRLPSL